MTDPNQSIVDPVANNVQPAKAEDDAKKAKDKVQDVLKQYEAKADELAAAKTKEIME